LLSAAKLAVVGGDKSNRAARNSPTHVRRHDMANHFGVSARLLMENRFHAPSRLI
jgi:hypothetical protein